jgi:hypothetical protein
MVIKMSIYTDIIEEKRKEFKRRLVSFKTGKNTYGMTDDEIENWIKEIDEFLNALEADNISVEIF